MLELIPELAFRADTLAVLLAIVLAGSAIRASLSSRRRLPLPPGPPGHWLFGNRLPREQYVQSVHLITPSIININVKSIAAVCCLGQSVWTRHIPPRRSQNHGHHWALPGES